MSDGNFVSMATTVLKGADSNHRYCVDRGPLPSAETTIFYYVWYRADECFAWDSTNRDRTEEVSSWTGVIVHTAFVAGAGNIVLV